ncbi:MAG TPA: quinone oxidoreductase [Spirochaetia bacterium]|nr:quinone oxidoreductase [Spirochaetia bacterium]
MKAIVMQENGGPDVLKLEDASIPEPGPGEARIRIEYAGVNFIDVYGRRGLYKGQLPRILGDEGAGIVDEVGTGVTEVRPGDRAAWAMQTGSYAEYAVVRGAMLIRVPDGLETKQAAAAMLQGMTAHYLAASTFALGPQHTALVHAAAGGTGRLLVQVARLRGARVIATASTEEKAALARSAGAEHVILYVKEDFEAETRRLSAGRGVDVVYDSVGQATFEKSLGCLRPRGTLVLFGQSSGPVAPFDPLILNRKGSLFLTRPSLGYYISDRDELVRRSGDVLGWVAAGRLELRIDRIFPLAEAAEAHRYLEARKTTGKVLLKVS